MKYTALFAVLTILVLGVIQPANAQTIIRDTEIEATLKEWFDPVFKGAGMDASQVDIILVQSPDVNAFVAGGANIFFYTGLIEKTENPEELIGVMAHELGHIQGGHLVRVKDAMENASYESILGAIIGVGAAIATGDGGAAAAISTGTNSMAQRRFLANARVFESSADQAAMKNMDQAGINPNGLLTFLKKLEDQEYAPASRQSEYVRTHPITGDRIDALKLRVEQSPHNGKPVPAHWVDQHKRMKAKITGFISPEQVAWTYDSRDTSIPAQYAYAIANYRQNKISDALSGIDGLIAKEPSNPYFHELKGQMLVDFGRLKEALPAYTKALSLMPDAPLILTSLGHVQIETAGENKAALEEAIKNLKKAEKKDKQSTRIHRLLATAYGRMGNDPMARLHLAEEAVLQRKYPYAKEQAEVAASGLKQGSSDWLRAQDLLAFISQQKGGQKSP